jgi:predicted N-acetyltransferase YhbS
MVTYQLEIDLSVQDYIEILTRSGLGSRRPINDRTLLNQMIKNSTLILTARKNGELVGLLRALSDGCYRTFIADLAVKENWQKKGIGKSLIQNVKKFSPEARLFLFSTEEAEEFYKKLGFQLHERCYQLKAGESI